MNVQRLSDICLLTIINSICIGSDLASDLYSLNLPLTLVMEIFRKYRDEKLKKIFSEVDEYNYDSNDLFLEIGPFFTFENFPFERKIPTINIFKYLLSINEINQFYSFKNMCIIYSF